MKKQVGHIILYGALILAGTYFLFKILVAGKVFLIPLTIAILLAMLLVPIAGKFERWGISRGLAAFLADLILIAFTVALFAVVGLQVKNIQKDWPKLQKEISKKASQIDEKLSQYSWGSQINISEKINSFSSGQDSTSNQGTKAQGQGKSNTENNSPGADQNNTSSSEKSNGVQQQTGSETQPQQSTGSGGFVQRGWMLLKSVFGFLGTMLLVFIYVFFFLLYRKKFHKSILKFVPKEKRHEADDIIKDSSKVAQQYLIGRLLLILFLAIIYSIGFMISGIEYGILIAVIAAALSIIPYVGNIIGLVFAGVIALASGGSTSSLIGVGVTFTIAQFVESYILEPFLVGHKVDINPVMTIVIVVFGDFIWGIPGMVLAIPLLAIVKVICDHVPALKPVGYAIGEEGIDSGENKFEKIAGWIKNKFRKKEPKDK